MMSPVTEISRIERLTSFYNFRTTVDVLRLDLVHPIISGNKWFKLKEYIAGAIEHDKKTLLTFGGAYSNHIVATAAAAQQQGLQSIGIIRGEKPPALSPTMQAAQGFGMKLCFISRADYKNKTISEEAFEFKDADEFYVIPEGGYGILGAKGAGTILHKNDTASYTHIITAVGTGTTLAGLVAAAQPHQKVIGISALKNNFSLQQEVENLLAEEQRQSFKLLYNYHFGGYARYTKELIHFMNELYAATHIPTDFVYTGKAFFAVLDLLKQGHFACGDKVLIIHTGGLQGNQSIKEGTLIYNRQ